MIATILPIAFGATFLFFALKFVGGFDNLRKIKAQIKENKQAPIDKHQLCCGFTKDSNNIYYYDKPLKNVDIKSFKIINFNWAKDTNVVYFNGNPISYIDKKSFQYLDYHYSIDTKNVYYDTAIISGADAITFKHIEGTQDGKDKNNCYRYGKKVDCKVLLTEE